MLVGSLRMKSGFLPAYHMNKNLWISIVLEGLENDGMIKNLIDWSYQVTAARKKEMEIDWKGRAGSLSFLFEFGENF